MRTRLLLHSVTALSLLALPALSAHAITYTFTPTLVDLTNHHSNDVTGVFTGSDSFTTSPYIDPLNITADGNSNGDEVELEFVFTSPGTGTGTITGDVQGRRNADGIDWDTTSDIVDLSNGSIVTITLPESVSLSNGGNNQNFFSQDNNNQDNNDHNSCPNGSVCGSTDITFTVTPGDPPPAVAPEPSSLALLGTGVLGVAGLIRRRLAL